MFKIEYLESDIEHDYYWESFGDNLVTYGTLDDAIIACITKLKSDYDKSKHASNWTLCTHTHKIQNPGHIKAFVTAYVTPCCVMEDGTLFPTDDSEHNVTIYRIVEA